MTVLGSLQSSMTDSTPGYAFLPLIFAGLATAVILGLQWFLPLSSSGGRRFEQNQSISKGAHR